MPHIHSKLRLTLVRSLAGRVARQQATVRGLGLKRLHQTVEVNATPCIKGMVNRVAFMLKIEEC